MRTASGRSVEPRGFFDAMDRRNDWRGQERKAQARNRLAQVLGMDDNGHGRIGTINLTSEPSWFCVG